MAHSSGMGLLSVDSCWEQVRPKSASYRNEIVRLFLMFSSEMIEKFFSNSQMNSFLFLVLNQHRLMAITNEDLLPNLAHVIVIVRVFNPKADHLPQ